MGDLFVFSHTILIPKKYFYSICLVARYGLSTISIEMPLFMGQTALIIQKCFRISALFRNFACN